MNNKMAISKIYKLIISMGIPMILSMVLQAVYNVVDTMFVINMGAEGQIANIALSMVFPIQILMIAIGVGTGVGLNTMLSKSLGEGNKELANKTAGNGIFLIIVFYIIFLFFGFFLTEKYMYLMTNNAEVIKIGKEYLRICCIFSIGSIGYAIYERFLISTGKTILSMVAQIIGAITNIILDYVFIYPLNMGATGAAYATIIGQILSLLLAMLFHYFLNKEISGRLKHIKPSFAIIKSIYKIGFPAFLMQGMLALMMFGVLQIISTINDEYTKNLLSGAYGIYYKLMQLALFASFGLSNTLISITSFNFGMRDKDRLMQVIKYGIVYSAILALLLTGFYQLFSKPISYLFALTIDESSIVSKKDILNVCELALHISTIGYVFMGISVGIQGILQGFNNVYKPVIISALRLIVLPLPILYIFTLFDSVSTIMWWTFPIAEFLTIIISLILLKTTLKKINLFTK